MARGRPILNASTATCDFRMKTYLSTCWLQHACLRVGIAASLTMAGCRHPSPAGNWAMPRGVAELIALLDDHENLRRDEGLVAGVEELTTSQERRRHARGIVDLIRQVRNAPNEEAVGLAAKELEQLGVDTLSDHQRDSYVDAWRDGDRSVVLSSVELLKHPDPGISRIGSHITAMLIRGDPLARQQAVDPLIAVLQDKGNGIDARYFAANLLGDTRDPRAVDSLMEALSDDEPLVQHWAAWSLGEIGPPAVESTPLLRALREQSSFEHIREVTQDSILKIETRRRIEQPPAP